VSLRLPLTRLASSMLAPPSPPRGARGPGFAARLVHGRTLYRMGKLDVLFDFYFMSPRIRSLGLAKRNSESSYPLFLGFAPQARRNWRDRVAHRVAPRDGP